MSVIYFTPLSLYLSVAFCSFANANTPQLTLGLPCNEGGIAQRSHYARQRFQQSCMLWLPPDIIVTRCSFEYLVSPHFTVAALDEGQRGSVRITSQNLISLERKLCRLVSLCIQTLPTHIHTALARWGSCHPCLFRLHGKEGEGEGGNMSQHVFMRGCRKGSNKPRWLETNVEDCECFHGNVNHFKISG